MRREPEADGERWTWPGREEAYARAVRSLESGDMGRAAREFEALLPHVGELADPADRVRVLLQSVECDGMTGRSAAAFEKLDRAEAAAKTGPQRAAVLREQAVLAFAVNDFARLAALGSRAAGAVPGATDPGALADLHLVLALTYEIRSEHALSVKAGRKAVLVSRGLPERRRLLFLQGLAGSLLGAGHFRRCAKQIEWTERTAGRLKPVPQDVLAGCAQIRWILQEREGDVVGAVEAMVGAHRAAERLGLRPLAASSLDSLIDFCMTTGWYSAALVAAERLRRMVDRAEPSGAPGVDWTPQLGNALIALGQKRALTAVIGVLRERTEGSPDLAISQTGYNILRRYAELRGDREEARAIARQAIRRFQGVRREPDPSHWIHWSVLLQQAALSRYDLEAGNVDRARRGLASLESLDLRKAHPRIRADADVLAAEIRLADGRPREAAYRALRGWSRLRAIGYLPDLLTGASVAVRALRRAAAAGVPGAAPRAALHARMLAWTIGAHLARLDSGHRSAFLRTPKLRAAANALAEAAPGLDPETVHRTESGPPIAVPKLARLDRAWTILVDAGLAGASDRASPIAEAERRTIEEALAATGGNVSAAARRLGIANQTLFNKLKRLGIGKEPEER